VITLRLLQSYEKFRQYGLNMGFQTWDAAGLTDLNSRLGRDVASGFIAVAPHANLSPDQSEIISAVKSSEERYRRVRPDRNMLTRFAGLWRETPQSILRFARKWGVLNIDKHGRPSNPVGPFERREPIEMWRYYSRRAQAILNIAANLKLGKVGALDDWTALHHLAAHSCDFLLEIERYGPFMLQAIANAAYPSRVKKGFKRTIETDGYMLSLEATLWLRLGRVSFVVGIENRGWTIEVDYGACMLSAIALQIALVLAAADSLYTCSGCNEPYIRHKKAPKQNQANFCDNCGRRKALQNADERRRRRMATARQLAHDGLSIRAISERLGAKPATVQRWLRNRRKL